MCGENFFKIDAEVLISISPQHTNRRTNKYLYVHLYIYIDRCRLLICVFHFKFLSTLIPRALMLFTEDIFDVNSMMVSLSSFLFVNNINSVFEGFTTISFFSKYLIWAFKVSCARTRLVFRSACWIFTYNYHLHKIMYNVKGNKHIQIQLTDVSETPAGPWVQLDSWLLCSGIKLRLKLLLHLQFDNGNWR